MGENGVRVGGVGRGVYAFGDLASRAGVERVLRLGLVTERTDDVREGLQARSPRTRGGVRRRASPFPPAAGRVRRSRKRGGPPAIAARPLPRRAGEPRSWSGGSIQRIQISPDGHSLPGAEELRETIRVANNLRRGRAAFKHAKPALRSRVAAGLNDIKARGPPGADRTVPAGPWLVSSRALLAEMRLAVIAHEIAGAGVEAPVALGAVIVPFGRPGRRPISGGDRRIGPARRRRRCVD